MSLSGIGELTVQAFKVTPGRTLPSGVVWHCSATFGKRPPPTLGSQLPLVRVPIDNDSKPRYSPRPQDDLHYVRRRRAAEKESETDSEFESEEDIDCDLSNMEITEELRHYFEQTERHQEELRKQKQLEAEHQEIYVEADHDLHLSTSRSVQPPAEKPGNRRMAEMRKLYGKGANKIQAMETIMQLNFDRNCDTKQPKYWPIISLKL
ncbi:gem-associated protein 8 [Crotalus tigris]|uniref:gem-associated protein 8 n=1 Tax=Crotalus tigris TaxID=88082 RepID=UPI00192F2C76|nr:gem-associated protein 8 [Crotalus tigris]